MTSQWKNPTFVRSNHFIILNSSAKDEFDLPKININSNNAIKILAIQKKDAKTQELAWRDILKQLSL
mgnify:FL=1|jgi:hypothetical protein